MNYRFLPIILWCIFCGLPYLGFAQCALEEISLSQKTAEATYIFDGIVTDAHVFWDNDHSHIITQYTVENKRSIKGDLAKYVSILQVGGQIGETIERVTPSMALEIGTKALFFADVTQLIAAPASLPALELYAGAQGVVLYDQSGEIATDLFRQYNRPNRQIYQPIAQQLGITLPKMPAYTPTAVAKQQEQQVAVIAGINPTTVAAGMNQIITITGSGFGTLSGNATVEFRNPDYFGLSVSYQSVSPAHIVSWSDSQIQVRVPGKDLQSGKAGAGSGFIRLVTSDGSFSTSSVALDVVYNKANINLREVDLVNDNAAGGYSFRLNTDFNANADRAAAFKRALDTWECQSNVNFVVATQTTITNCPSNNGINTIAMDNACSLPSGTLSQTTQWFTVCANGDAFLSEMDIIFSSATNWNYTSNATTSTKKDFETIALHELGHAIGMGHVLGFGKLMYPALSNAYDNRMPDDDALSCVHRIVAHSSQNNSCGGSTAMIPTTSCQVRAKVRAFLEGAYNGTSMNTAAIMPTGQPFSNTPWLYKGIESLPNIPTTATDWILAELRSDQNTIVARAAGVIYSDGLIKSIDGSDGLLFKGVQQTANGQYYIVLRHRNHLAIITPQPISLPNIIAYNLTTSASAAAGANQLKPVSGGKYALRAGDINADGVITVADFNIYTTQSSLINQYKEADCNLDSSVTVADFNRYISNSSFIGQASIRY